ncbi:hypothetical protein [Massilia sp. Leaf139]|uniref:hypothetical protein n=1 Tax=Massilia sp. Leaf139 TaxID=1736272 RepID=UPI0006F8A13E|nr:hypothetical protein [Massilia sp. Leaf139]KQQ96097.1 hypothetical protein ASF77_21570 [Massilia sp. Leaf139]
MRLSEITSILAAAGLPALSRDQLLELAGSGGGKRFQAALIAFGAGDRQRRPELEVTVRVFDAKTRSTLQRIGGQLPVDQLITLACKEQRRFFDAIDAIAMRTPRAAAARSYLAELGAAAAIADSAPAGDPPYYSFKIFGAAAALCISEATTRAERKHTINIEGAVALAGGGVRKTFDWPNKIVVQLTVQEAYQVLALLENKIRSVRFDGHGREHDKSLQIEFQDSHYFFRLIQRGKAAVAVQVRAVDSLQIVSLLYKQFLANEPHLRIDDVRTMVDRMATMAHLVRSP